MKFGEYSLCLTKLIKIYPVPGISFLEQDKIVFNPFFSRCSAVFRLTYIFFYVRRCRMPTFNQLVHTGREVSEKKAKAPALLKGGNSK